MKTIRLLFAVVLLMAGIIPTTVEAKNQQAQKSNKVIKAVEKKKNEELGKETGKIVKEALDGVVLTKKAYQLLDQDKSAEAKGKIIEALSKLDAAISANQGVDLLPIEADVQVLTGVYDLPTAIGLRDAALEVLGLGDVQAARALLDPMVDEIDVEVVSIPITIYKAKLNDALGKLENSKKWEARQSLRDAFSLFVIDTEVIPIPLIEAESLIDEAVEAEKTDKKQAVQLLKQANDALSLSDVLGYTTKENKNLLDKIHKENKKLSKLKHRKLKETIIKKVSNLEAKIKDGTSDMHKKMSDQISKIKEKLSSKK